MNRIRRTIDVVLILLFIAAGVTAIGMWLKDRPFPAKAVTAPAKPSDSREELRIVAWNVESGGSDPATISTQLTEFKGDHVFCLSEVDPDAFSTYLDAVDAVDDRPFKSINGTSGRDDRLQIIYDANRLELLETTELTTYRDYKLNDGRHRSPLVALFRDRKTGSRFYIVQNHLARGDEPVRNAQAVALREWARDQSVSTAVVVIGDINFDFDFRTGKGNAAFDELARDGVLHWVRPQELIDTNWSDRDGDGKDDYPDSMLDGAYVAGPAKNWDSSCRVITWPGDFPDDESTSDHRPIELSFHPITRTMPGLVHPKKSQWDMFRSDTRQD